MKQLLCFVILLFSYTSYISAQYIESGTGTGFFISSDGLIITCAHVIEGNSKTTVKINNIEYDATIISKNDTTDLALLKINYKNSYHFKISNFNNSNLGDKILVLGYPLSDILGSDIRVTDGIISSRSGIASDQSYFQHSAPIQPGNSGGPIINNNFEIIGIAASKLNDMATLISTGIIPQNVNFGIKSENINNILQSNRVGNGNIKTIDNAINATVQIICYTTRAVNIITITNKTGYIGYYLYISPSSSNKWGNDYLGSGILRNGHSIDINRNDLLNDINNTYDIQLVDEDKDTYTKRNVKLNNNLNIEFSISDLDIRSNNERNTSDNLPSIRILNNTGFTIYFIYISPTSTDKWEEDVLGDDVLLNRRSISIRLAYSLNVFNRYDIKIVDKDGDTYTKWNVLITPNMTIEYTIRDLD